GRACDRMARTAARRAARVLRRGSCADARLFERALSRRRASRRRVATAVVLPHADRLLALAVPPSSADGGAALREPRDTADRGDPRAALGGTRAAGRRR